MTHETNNDDTLFDRLVDGELSTIERQQLLASFDNRQDGWRKCALAFLESQALGHQFKQMVTEPVTQQQVLATPPQNTFTESARLGWLAIAAGLIMAFSLGWLSHQMPTGESQKTLIANSDSLDSADQQIAAQEMLLPDEQQISEDAVTLLVRDTSGKDRRLQVPLMEIENLDKQFAGQFASTLPANLRNQFRDHGFDLRGRRRFAPMFFEQNKQLIPMVVPVDDTYVVPVSRTIY